MKEKIINARITEDLYNKISQKAQKNQVTVSNLLRTLLEDSIDITSDISNLLDSRIKDFFSEEKIIGYQEIIILEPQVCLTCNSKINSKEKAYIIITNKSLEEKRLICSACYKKD